MTAEMTRLDRLRQARDRLHEAVHAEGCIHSTEDGDLHVHRTATGTELANMTRVYADVLDRIATLEGEQQPKPKGPADAGVEGLADAAKGKLRAVPGSGRR